MRGRALLFIGVVLMVSNASGSTGAASSIAEEAQSARDDVPIVAVVALLPLPSEDAAHAARRPSRLVAKPVTWRTPVAAAAASSSQKSVRGISPYLPVVDQPDIQERHKIIASEVLRLLPVACVNQIENFYVRYDKPERRGLAGKSTIILDGTLPDDEFRAVLIHEALGHVFDLGCLTGTEQSGPSTFRDGSERIFNDDPSLAFYLISWLDSSKKKPDVRPEDFVSGYAETDPFEDLAESAIYYVLQRQTFAERARSNRALLAKYKWLQTFLTVSPPVAGTHVAAWDGTVPWDATKLKYEWKGQVIAKR